MDTPILLIIFNKPDTTYLVLEQIAAVKPKKLYIASDGPRLSVPGEAAQVRALREKVLSLITWPCDLNTSFRTENLGCSVGPNRAISWLFENEEFGIILEDDTVPDLSFFPYCEELLIRYRFDTRIGMISGNNHLPEYEFADSCSYLFSKFKWTWGWATWRRCWVNQDLELRCMKSSSADSIIANMGYGRKSFRTWNNNLQSIEKGRVAAWDYQWFLSLSAQYQLSIIPRVNLVSNIGFGIVGATHCVESAPPRFLETDSVQLPLVHPHCCVPNINHERLYESYLVSDGRGYSKFMPRRLRDFLKWLLLQLSKGSH